MMMDYYLMRSAGSPFMWSISQSSSSSSSHEECAQIGKTWGWIA
jgi:hypothetical protein